MPMPPCPQRPGAVCRGDYGIPMRCQWCDRELESELEQMLKERLSRLSPEVLSEVAQRVVLAAMAPLLCPKRPDAGPCIRMLASPCCIWCDRDDLPPEHPSIGSIAPLGKKRPH